jgi:hyperosmotically inducible protein
MKRIALAFLIGTLAVSAPELVAKGNAVPANVRDSRGEDHPDPWVAGPESESSIVRQVRHELIMLPYYGVFDDLGFVLNGATVTLVGQVTQPMLKNDAERVVKRVEGVAAVINNIEVLPLSTFDNQIRHRVYQAIYGDPMLSTRYGFRALPSIHIIVKNGHVRLEGVVANEMDRNLAGMRASGVPGTFEVINGLRVEQSK